ncbi:hypothetical protein BASA83_011460 [Batrachochytrium salamandrivorans]|nr:hypothetical protein BASA83_011460 [Batrachochytrium salamandrivorans]
MHDMLDIDRAGKVSGSRFYYLKNAGAMLEMALTRPRSDDPQTYYVSSHVPREPDAVDPSHPPVGSDTPHCVWLLLPNSPWQECMQGNTFVASNEDGGVLNMPTEELGAPAHIKYDMEAWMPGRKTWGEMFLEYTSIYLPSLDGQTITGGDDKGTATEFVHTVNGTACAVPRLLIALLETHQTRMGIFIYLLNFDRISLEKT